jgi:hypothetical protein
VPLKQCGRLYLWIIIGLSLWLPVALQQRATVILSLFIFSPLIAPSDNVLFGCSLKNKALKFDFFRLE